MLLGQVPSHFSSPFASLSHRAVSALIQVLSRFSLALSFGVSLHGSVMATVSGMGFLLFIREGKWDWKGGFAV